MHVFKGCLACTGETCVIRVPGKFLQPPSSDLHQQHSCFIHNNFHRFYFIPAENKAYWIITKRKQ